MWQPTGGKLQRLEKALNTGIHNGLSIFIHYSSEAGIRSIVQAKAITDVNRNATRPGSAVGIYLCPGTHTHSIKIMYLTYYF